MTHSRWQLSQVPINVNKLDELGHAYDLFDLEIWESGIIGRLFSMHTMQANTMSP